MSNAPLIAAVHAAMLRLGSATSHEVFAALRGGRRVTLVGVGRALDELHRLRRLWRELLPEHHEDTYRYHNTPNGIPPIVGERMRDLVDPYLRAVE